MIEPRKTQCGADAVIRAEGNRVRTEWVGSELPTGVEEQGMYTRVAQELGRAHALLVR